MMIFDAHVIRALASAGMKKGVKGIALIIPMALAVWLAVGDRMDEHTALIKVQTARIASLNERIRVLSEKVRHQADFEDRLMRLEAAVYGQAMRDAKDWRTAHCAWIRKQGLEVPEGMCQNASHEDVYERPQF